MTENKTMNLKPVPGLEADDLENFTADIMQCFDNVAPKVSQKTRGVTLKPPTSIWFTPGQLEDLKIVVKQYAEQADFTLERVRLVLKTSAQLRADRAARELDLAAGVPLGRYWKPRPAIDPKPLSSKAPRGKTPRGPVQELIFGTVKGLAPSGGRIEVAKVLDKAMIGFVPDESNRVRSKANRRIALRKALQGLVTAGLLSLFDDATMVSTFAGEIVPEDEFQELLE
jgi:hypothetical protein